MKKQFGSLSVITLFALALTFASCKKKEEAPRPRHLHQLQRQSQRRHHRRAMLNQIHQLLTRRLVQKKEEPKAKQIQFSTGFPKIAAPGPLQVPGVCYPSFMTTKVLIVMHIEPRKGVWFFCRPNSAQDLAY